MIFGEYIYVDGVRYLVVEAPAVRRSRRTTHDAGSGARFDSPWWLRWLARLRGGQR